MRHPVFGGDLGQDLLKVSIASLLHAFLWEQSLIDKVL